MSEPITLLPERTAIIEAIRALENRQASAALELLQRAMSRRRPPSPSHPDRRTDGVVRLRAYIEQAIVELDHGHPDAALQTLRLAFEPSKLG